MKLLRLFPLILLTLVLNACSTTSNTATNTATKLRANAKQFLSGPVLAAAESLALQYVFTGKVDDIHSLASALWKNGGADSLTQTLTDVTGHPALASAATSLVNKATQSGGIAKEDAASAVAAVLSSVALSH